MLMARAVARPRSLQTSGSARSVDASRADISARVETPAVESSKLEPVKSETRAKADREARKYTGIAPFNRLRAQPIEGVTMNCAVRQRSPIRRRSSRHECDRTARYAYTVCATPGLQRLIMKRSRQRPERKCGNVFFAPGPVA